jgi:glycosyltransferase involved in cell wall biosynthesis
MRVLLLRRRPFGGIATYTGLLATALAGHGIEAEIEEASDWIPNETGSKVDKAVSERLAERAKDFDLVHAFGMRPAWACAAAFGYKEAWIYSALDMPKTTHRILIDKLNQAQMGICASNAVLTALDHALALDLTEVSPGVPQTTEPPPSKAAARASLSLPADVPLVAALGRFVPERGFGALVSAMETVWESVPDARLCLAGQGELEGELRVHVESLSRGPQVTVLGVLPEPQSLLAAADLVAVPSANAGFSMAAIEAMNVGTPVLLRNKAGLREVGVPEVSAYTYDLDEELGPRLAELLAMPISLESVGQAGRLRVLERFTLEQSVESVVEIYRSILQDVI